jgi:hypothetical protein
MATQLSVLTAVLDGHADALRSVVSSLPLGGGSPFASVPGTHNGRFVVVSPRPLAPATFLMCSATFDGPVHRWIDDFLRVLGTTADDIWSHCAAWPAPVDARAAYLVGHRVQPALEFATWDAPVERVVDALAMRRRVAHIAVRAQGLDPASLLAAYRAEFTP